MVGTGTIIVGIALLLVALFALYRRRGGSESDEETERMEKGGIAKFEIDGDTVEIGGEPAHSGKDE